MATEFLLAAVHELTYVDADGRVVLMNTDTGEVLWRSRPVPAPVESLQWSADGERLLVAADGFATLLDARGNGLFKGPVATAPRRRCLPTASGSQPCAPAAPATRSSP